MPLALPNPNVEAPLGEELSPQQMGQKLREIQQNLDRLAAQFPVSGSTLANTVLRLAVAENRRIAFGTVELEWNGAGPTSNTKEVSHGLGAAPVVVHLNLARLITVAGSAELFGFGIEPTSKTIFKVNATLATGLVPGAGTKVKFFWTAIG